MKLAIGVDVGLSGALALVSETEIVQINDMPTYNQVVGKKTKRKIDHLGVRNILQGFAIMGARTIIIETVYSRPKQGVTSQFTFGYIAGVLDTAALYEGFVVEPVIPAVWKKALRVPGKGDDDGILIRADQLFPGQRHLWHGKLGGARLDRAEAAMLGKFGVDHMLHRIAAERVIVQAGAPKRRPKR